ncbi:MAG: YfcE family phosphodiesterase [Geobacteraceae bacterium]|nr:YfcE family phosphodiesterase [Geobacteraceae bacterium]
MKIAVLSDTHGNYPLGITILDRISGLDCIIHLGDILHDADIIGYALDIPVIKLAGNCDSAPNADRELLLNISDMTIFLSHGDLYGVKNGIERIYEKASSEKAGIILYGHTHVPAIQKKGEILLVNPGSLKAAAAQQSLAILNILNREVSAEIIVANGQLIR